MFENRILRSKGFRVENTVTLQFVNLDEER